MVAHLVAVAVLLLLVPFPIWLAVGAGMNLKTLAFVALGVLGALVVDRFVGVSKLLA
jgi:hypothetical protein